MKRPLALPALACLALLGLGAQEAAAGDVTFRIRTAWAFNYIEPPRKSYQTLTTFFVTLKADGSITERLEAGSSVGEADTMLGEARGGRGSITWKVVNETTLVRLLARDSHTFAIWVRTQGKDSCTATLEWRLKPGFTSYEIRNRSGKVTARFSDPGWPTARCDVL